MTPKQADPHVMAKKPKRERYLGPATVVKPALIGASALLVIQGAMKMFLHA